MLAGAAVASVVICGLAGWVGFLRERTASARGRIAGSNGGVSFIGK